MAAETGEVAGGLRRAAQSRGDGDGGSKEDVMGGGSVGQAGGSARSKT